MTLKETIQRLQNYLDINPSHADLPLLIKIVVEGVIQFTKFNDVSIYDDTIELDEDFEIYEELEEFCKLFDCDKRCEDDKIERCKKQAIILDLD